MDLLERDYISFGLGLKNFCIDSILVCLLRDGIVNLGFGVSCFLFGIFFSLGSLGFC